MKRDLWFYLPDFQLLPCLLQWPQQGSYSAHIWNFWSVVWKMETHCASFCSDPSSWSRSCARGRAGPNGRRSLPQQPALIIQRHPGGMTCTREVSYTQHFALNVLLGPSTMVHLLNQVWARTTIITSITWIAIVEQPRCLSLPAHHATEAPYSLQQVVKSWLRWLEQLGWLEFTMGSWLRFTDQKSSRARGRLPSQNLTD